MKRRRSAGTNRSASISTRPRPITEISSIIREEFIKGNKLQHPPSKFQRSSNVQAPNISRARPLGAWSLNNLWCLVLGAWCFSFSNLRNYDGGFRFLRCHVHNLLRVGIDFFREQLRHETEHQQA